ncbi:MAG: ABC transporter permease [Bacteroidota bacterium]
MLELIFKTSIRNLLKNKVLTTINVLGLSLGITCALVIYLITRYETSFDKYHENYNNIYTVYTTPVFGEHTHYHSGIPFPFHQVLKEEIPNIKVLSQLFITESRFSIPNERSVRQQIKIENDVVGVDTAFFKVFDWNWLKGSPETALLNSTSIVLTEKTAFKIFGTLDILGREVLLNKEHLLVVTGLVADPPAATNFEFAAFVSTTLLEENTKKYAGWTTVSDSYQNFIVIDGQGEQKKKNAALIQKQINEIYVEKIKETGLTWKLGLQSLADIHFSKELPPITGKRADKKILWYLFFIGLVLIFSACINYVNLATAISVLRSTEIGVRKIMGSNIPLLVLQFLGETFLLVTLSVILSLCLTELFLLKINFFIEMQIKKSLLGVALQNDPFIYLFISCVVLLITLLSGLYPAYITASYTPLNAIKNKIHVKGKKGASLRRILVVTQFCLCQLFIFGTIVVMQQLEYTQNKDLGFKKEHVVSVFLPKSEISKREVLKNELLTLNGISNVSLSSFIPMSFSWASWEVWFEKDSTRANDVSNVILADRDYFETYGFNFLAGAPFHESDTMEAVVVNQAFLKLLGVEKPEEALYKEIFYGDGKQVAISGVVADFHLTSFHKEIKPLMIGTIKERMRTANVKITPQKQQATLAAMEEKWSKFFPDEPFAYKFLEDSIFNMYKTEKLTYRLFNLFAVIAIFISCLGLYGLISFISLQKTKEIGIRKILGASVNQIVLLFSKEFMLLVLIALLIAGPLGYYFMNNWLADFAYKIDIGWEIFALTLLIAMFIALFTVSYQSIKSALQNPVESLHTD